MVITAFVDRFENDNAILLAEDAGVEISIPGSMIKGTYSVGEFLTVTIDEKGNIIKL